MLTLAWQRIITSSPTLERKHPKRSSTPAVTPGRIKSTRRTPPRPPSCQKASLPHRKARSSSSSVSAGKSSHGVQLTCQEYPGNSPSTHFTSIPTQGPSNNRFDASQSQIEKLLERKSIGSSKPILFGRSSKLNGWPTQY